MEIRSKYIVVLIRLNDYILDYLYFSKKKHLEKLFIKTNTYIVSDSR